MLVPVQLVAQRTELLDDKQVLGPARGTLHANEVVDRGNKDGIAEQV